MTPRCERCGGTGEIFPGKSYNYPCPDCGGTGEQPTTDTERRVGFWLDAYGALYAGYFESEDNFHYARITQSGVVFDRSSEIWPDKLTPIPFREGLHRACDLLKPVLPPTPELAYETLDGLGPNPLVEHLSPAPDMERLRELPIEEMVAQLHSAAELARAVPALLDDNELLRVANADVCKRLEDVQQINGKLKTDLTAALVESQAECGRLRRLVEVITPRPACKDGTDEQVKSDIERLERENDDLRKRSEKAEDECKRLKAVLKEIANLADC